MEKMVEYFDKAVRFAVDAWEAVGTPFLCAVCFVAGAVLF